MMKKRLLAPLAAALVLTLLGAPSLAQFGGGGGGNAPGAARSVEAPSGPQTRASQVSEKLYELRARLQLTPEQTPPWQTVYDQMWDLAARGGAPGRPMTDDDGSPRPAASSLPPAIPGPARSCSTRWISGRRIRWRW